MATLYRVDGTREEVSPRNGESFELDEVYQILGIEVVQVVHTKDGTLLLIDEEGKLNNAPKNEAATERMPDYFQSLDYIVGNALECTEEEFP